MLVPFKNSLGETSHIYPVHTYNIQCINLTDCTKYEGTALTSHMAYKNCCPEFKGGQLRGSTVEETPAVQDTCNYSGDIDITHSNILMLPYFKTMCSIYRDQFLTKE